MAVGANLAYATVSVGTSAVLLVAGRALRDQLIIENVSANDVYIGGDASVATTTGVKLMVGSTTPTSISLSTSAAVYAIASGAASDVRVLEVY